MKISRNWLRKIVPFDWTVEELSEKLTMSGSEVEVVEEFSHNFDNIITAEVRNVVKHPDADKLTVCEVYDGSKSHSVVCGAPNVAARQKVILAKVGAELPGGLKIKKAKIRGVESEGMICSQKELELGEDASGIAVLPDNTDLGIPIREIVGEEDYILELEITPNRPDCLSHRGLAREVQALEGGKLSSPAINLSESDIEASAEVAVSIQNPEDCPRYAARVIKNVRIGPSPLWLSTILHRLGIRSINNVVDITNYVMMEYGHPLHAFDFDLFSDNKVVVRGAKKGEKFTTLDEVEREIPEGSVFITDGNKPVALGGVMGGLDSEVTENTQNVLLESAYFNPVTVRKTAKAVKLSTESSQRFERGADCENLTIALDRAAALIAELTGGDIARGIVDCYPKKHQPVSIRISASEVNRLLGTELSLSKIESILRLLDINTKHGDSDILTAEIPSFRPDLTRPADLIEEIARIYGFGNINSREQLAGSTEVIIPESFRIAGQIRRFFASAGFDEVVNWVLYDPKKYDKSNLQFNPVTISNPLSEDTAILRPRLWGSLLDNICYNLNRNLQDIAIFEIGHVYSGADSEDELPEQKLALCLAWTGNAHNPGWDVPAKPVDIYDLKGLAEDFIDEFNMGKSEFVELTDDSQFDPVYDKELLIGLNIHNKTVCRFGRVANNILSIFDIKTPVWIMELDLEYLKGKTFAQGYYKEPPKFPPSDRDLALVVDGNLQFGEIYKFITGLKLPLLEDIRLFDIYTGKQIDPGKKSLALSLRFRHPERTLKDKDIDKAMKKIISELKVKYKLDLRQ